MTPDSLWRLKSPRSKRIAIRSAGVVIVVISMFLPAVTSDSSGIPGYFCAGFTLMGMFQPIFHAITTPHAVGGWKEAFGSFFLSICGLINPLLVVSLVAKRSWRKPLLILVAVLFIDVVYLLAKMHLVPRIGFFLWVVGILLILAAPFLPRPSKPEIPVPAA